MSKDLYKYFRVEARELIDGLTHGVLQMEKGAASKDDLARLLRLAHTLKGASRVVKQTSIAEAAHALEDVLAPHRRTGDSPISPDEINQVLKLIDSMVAALKALEPSPEPAPHPTAPPAVEDTFQTARVSIDELDSLLEGVSQAGVQLGALGKLGVDLEGLERLSASLLNELEQQRSDSTDRTRHSNGELRGTADRLHASLVRIRRESTARLSTLASEMRQIRDQGNTLRLLPASVIFPSLERAVRDAAQLLNKEVEFKTSGGENRLDGHMLSALRDALLHLVRNAVDHGLEPPAERARSGKQSAGSILLKVERRGNRMVFSCVDDGRGIDLEQVRNSAVSHGLLSRAEAHALSADEAMRLIFRSGISTRSAVTDVSGRGVGLDVVREVAERFKGEVKASSEIGAGTTIEMSAPVSLSSFTALVVDAAGLTPCFPLDSVRHITRLSEAEIGQGTDHATVLYDEQAIPFFSLASVLGKEPSPSGGGRALVVVVQGVAGLAAFAVDRLNAIAEVVVKPLPSLVGTLPILAGVAFDSEGDPQPILDPDALVAFAQQAKRPVAIAAAPSQRKLPLLVIDDSLTTRMLEQSILESAGFEVDLATSAEEAMEKARLRRYGMFIVDVEMPGMNGFDFIARTRQDANLRETPAMLVTSLSSEADRRRGIEVGARFFMAKGEFNQERFLSTIRSLAQ